MPQAHTGVMLATLRPALAYGPEQGVDFLIPALIRAVVNVASGRGGPMIEVARRLVARLGAEDGLDIGPGPPLTKDLAEVSGRNARAAGKLVLKDGAVISTECNLRAAGGRIELGRASAVGQNAVLVAANHPTGTGRPHLLGRRDEARTGVIPGGNVWVGANCTLLPGPRIGGDRGGNMAGAAVRAVAFRACLGHNPRAAECAPRCSPLFALVGASPFGS